jgi:anaerobic magnesium-protoporphyrin IX monomethyl ester cyclase
MTKKIIPIVESESVDYNQLFNDPTMGDDKHVTMAKTMMQYARPRPQANLTKLEIPNVTRKTTVALVLMPKWAVFFAPYNVARLAAVVRAAGYKTSVYDWNVDTWHKLKASMPTDPYAGFGSTDFMWTDDMYAEQIEPHLLPVLEGYLEQLVELKPDVVGFSLYYTNVLPTLWLARKLKERLPKTKFIAGGSHFQWGPPNYPEFDHVVKGEGEALILELLEKIENNVPIDQYHFDADKTTRIDLDQLPFPDYSDMDINKYMLPSAISTEISRGCVAKCSFCSETHFWKYRNRQAPRVLEEVEHQYNTLGARMFWFIDSLVNGNLNELRAFAIGVAERKLDISWEGYARCDGRMDLDYLQDLKNSGCTHLNYGIESGSQRVLDAMRKNTNVESIEQNLRDGKAVGINHHSQWMLCFPNEEPVDFARTMTLAWRVQDCNMSSMARGTMGVGPGHVHDNKDKYNVLNQWFLDEWATKDFRSTKTHRLIRLKSFNIFIQQLPLLTENKNFPNTKLLETYNLEFSNPTAINPLDLSYEEFDYNIIKDANLDTPFKESLVNEIWPLVRTLWRTRNHTAFKFSINFDPEWDRMSYGSRLAGSFMSKFNFSIDSAGEWTASCQSEFICPENPWKPWALHDGVHPLSHFNFELDWQGAGKWEY